MSAITVVKNLPTVSESETPTSYTDLIVGAAVFDLNGLPKEYFVTAETANMSWVQTIFQALGLRSLLMSSLQLEGFQHATVRGETFCALVVKQRSQYTALLLRHQEDVLAEPLIQWAQNFQMSELKQDPRFQAA